MNSGIYQISCMVVNSWAYMICSVNNEKGFPACFIIIFVGWYVHGLKYQDEGTSNQIAASWRVTAALKALCLGSLWGSYYCYISALFGVIRATATHDVNNTELVKLAMKMGCRESKKKNHTIINNKKRRVIESTSYCAMGRGGGMVRGEYTLYPPCQRMLFGCEGCMQNVLIFRHMCDKRLERVTGNEVDAFASRYCELQNGYSTKMKQSSISTFDANTCLIQCS